MKVTYSYIPLGASVAINELICPGDATHESPLDWRPSAEGVIQPAGFPGAQEGEVFARGNTIVTRVFRVWRKFNTRQNALAYSLDMELLPGTAGTLTMQNEGSSGGRWTAEVGCQRALVELDVGVSLLLAFQFIGPRAARANPAPN